MSTKVRILGQWVEVGILPQPLGTTDDPLFNRLTLGQDTGLSPLVIESTTLVVNLNADMLDGLHASDLALVGHNHSGTYLPLVGGSLSGEVTFSDDGEGLTFFGSARVYKRASGSITLRRPTGDADPVVEKADASQRWKIWHEGNDGSGSGLNSDMLDDLEGAAYATRSLVGSLQGDLLYVGTYDPYKWSSTDPTNLTNLPSPTYWVPEIVNLVTNSSFEWDTDSSGVADGWTAWTAAVPTSTSRSMQTSGPHSGQRYQRCVATLDGAGEQFGIQQTVGGTSQQTVTAGETYTFSAYVKGTFPATTRLVTSIGWYNSSGVLIGSRDTSNDTPSGAWSRIQATRTAPVGAFYVNVAFYAEWVSGVGGATTFDIDSVMIEDAATASKYEPKPSESYRHGMQWIVAFPRVKILFVTNKALTSNVATLTTSVAHTLQTGDVVNVNDVDATFNGTYTVTATPTATTFTYSKTAANVTSTASSGAVRRDQGAVEVGFIDSDLSGRLDPQDGEITLTNGDFIIANNAAFTGDLTTPLTISDVVFSYVPVSAEILIASAVQAHADNPNDPHAAAGYLVPGTADALYAPLVHDHTAAIVEQVDLHSHERAILIQSVAVASNVVTVTTTSDHDIRVGQTIVISDCPLAAFNGRFVVTTTPSATTLTVALVNANLGTTSTSGFVRMDPHPQYLEEDEASTLYATVDHTHPSLYEPIGLVVAHEGKSDPHPQYMTLAETSAAFAPVVHGHDDAYYTKAQVDGKIAAVPDEVQATDTASSARVFIGSTAPSSPLPGDIWIECTDVALSAPAVASNFIASATSPTTVSLSWTAWPGSAALSGLVLERWSGAAWTTLVSGTGQVSYSDTGLSENSLITYRLTATNAAGSTPTTVTVTTLNGTPAVPSGLSVSSITSTGCTLSWTASATYRAKTVTNKALTSNVATLTTSAAHGYVVGESVVVSGVDATFNGTYTIASVPTTTTFTYAKAAANVTSAASGGTTVVSDVSSYEVSVNGAVVATPSTTSQAITGLVERTSYTLGVATKDTGGLKSTVVTTGTTTTNGSPDAVPYVNTVFVSTSGIDAVVATNYVRVEWDRPLTGLPGDFSSYEVSFVTSPGGVDVTGGGSTSGGSPINGSDNSWRNTIALPYGATLVARVRLVDNLGATSAWVSSSPFTTTSTPDTTPPGPALITSFKPETSFGRMVVRGTWPSDVDLVSGKIEYLPPGGGYGVWYSAWSGAVTPGATFSQVVTTIGSGSGNPQISVRIRVTDSSGNERIGNSVTYTLKPSPQTVYPSATNHYCFGNGGMWNNNANGRPYEGYYSLPGNNYAGFFFYGTQARSVIYNAPVTVDGSSVDRTRTVSSAYMYVERKGCGAAGGRRARVCYSPLGTSPGTVTANYGSVTINTDYTQAISGLDQNTATPGIGQGLSVNLVNALVGLTQGSLVLYDNDGTGNSGADPTYACFATPGENGQSGRLMIYHLG